MELLEWLQEIRNPVFTKINMLFTTFGSELVIAAVIFFLYWCVSKKTACRIGFVYFISGLIVQTMKLIFRIPRPWVTDTKLHPVEEAVKSATGYSFPSGHTQSATAFYGTIACISRRKSVQFSMLFIILAVAFSRLYLGVHTPLDVTAALLITIVVVILCNAAVDRKWIYRLRRETFTGILMIMPLGMLIYGIAVLNSGAADLENVLDCFKAAGAAAGFILGWYLETSRLDFDETAGSRAEKAVRFIAGIVLILGLRFGLKALLGNGFAAGFIRYFIMIFTGVFLYPLIFCGLRRRREKNSAAGNK